MSGWFAGILWNSLAVSAFALILLCFSPLLSRHFKARTHYRLWVIVLLFLVNPFHPKITVPALSGPAVRLTAPVTAWVEQAQTDTAAPARTGAASAAPVGPAKARSGDWARTLLPKAVPFLWLGGCLFLLMKEGIRHRRLFVGILRTGHPAESALLTDELERLKEKMGVKSPVSLVISPAVSTPVSTGLRRPVIILPHERYAAREAAYILAHELVHCRRKDPLAKWLTLLAAAVNWFNPLVYVFGKMADHLCELSCDAEVLQGHDRSERFAYGMLVLESGAPARPLPLASGFGAGKKLVMQRLRLIMDGGAKRGGVFLTVLALLVCAGLSVSFVQAGAKPSSGGDSRLPNADSVRKNSALVAAFAKDAGIDLSERMHRLGETVDFKFYDFYDPNGPDGKDHPRAWQQYTVSKAAVYGSLQEAGLTAADLLDIGYTPNGIDSRGRFKPGYKLLVVDMTEKNIIPFETTPDPSDKCPIGAGVYRGAGGTPILSDLVYLPDSLAKETGREGNDGYAVKIPVGQSRSFRVGWLMDTSNRAPALTPSDLYLCVMSGTNDELRQWVDLGLRMK